MRRRRGRGAGPAPIAALAACLAAPPAVHAQGVLFTMVQISDCQVANAQDQAQFEIGLDAIVAGGHPAALLPRPVDVVLFAGDLVNANTVPQWISFIDTIEGRLTANGIPIRYVPGNKDQSGGDFTNYEQYIGSTGVWSVGSAGFTGHNGVPFLTNWDGLRFIGCNNSNGAFNVVDPADVAEMELLTALAAANLENVFLVCHHHHNNQNQIPLLSVLEMPNVVGYMRGHAHHPHAFHGLVGVDNPNVWDLNSNSTNVDGGLIYCEVFTTEIKAYVLRLVDDPVALPPPATIPLVYPMTSRITVPPVADFVGSPRSGPAPLAVSFVDLSSGYPTGWTWDFGDGQGSSTFDTVHVYDEPGTYSVSLEVANDAGTDSVTFADYITVDDPVPTTVLLPVADARVNANNPSTNFGLSDTLRCRDDTYDSYLQFDASGIDRDEIVSAVLRLHVTDASPDGGTLYLTDDDWTETGITWDNAPALTGPPLGSTGNVVAGTWIELDVLDAVRGPGVYSFGLTNDSTNSVLYWSREGAEPPELVIQFEQPCGGQCRPGEVCVDGECESACPWDLDDDGMVGATELLELLALWGTNPGGPPDFDGNGTVDTADLLALLGGWGACP